MGRDEAAFLCVAMAAEGLAQRQTVVYIQGVTVRTLHS